MRDNIVEEFNDLYERDENWRVVLSRDPEGLYCNYGGDDYI